MPFDTLKDLAPVTIIAEVPNLLTVHPPLPQLPTVAESALPGFAVTVRYGVLAPAGTPPDIVTRLNSIIAKTLATPTMRERLLGQGAEPTGNSPEEFAAQMQRDLVKWANVIRDSGAKLD